MRMFVDATQMPLKVGDRVRWYGGPDRGVVVANHRDYGDDPSVVSIRWNRERSGFAYNAQDVARFVILDC